MDSYVNALLHITELSVNALLVYVSNRVRMVLPVLTLQQNNTNVLVPLVTKVLTVQPQ